MTQPLALRIEPAAVLQAIQNSTQPTGTDYYYGGVRPEDVAAYQRHIQQVDRFHQWYAGLPKFTGQIRTKEDMFDTMGRWLDEAVGAAPDISDDQTRKYWSGCRKYTQMPVRELVDVVRRLHDFKTRYEVMLDLQGEWIKTFDKKIVDAYSATDHPGFNEHSWRNTLTFVGLLAGVGIGVGVGIVVNPAVGAVVGEKVAALLPALGLLGGGAGGTATGWVGGNAVDTTRRANYLAQLTKDWNDFRALRQTHRHLMQEGVHHRTLERMVDIMQRYDVELQLKPDPERKAFIERMTRRRLENALRGNAKAWDALAAHVVQAVTSNDPQAFGRALVAIADAGNALHRGAKLSADTRVENVLGGHAQGMPPDPLKDPEALWL